MRIARRSITFWLTRSMGRLSGTKKSFRGNHANHLNLNNRFTPPSGCITSGYDVHRSLKQCVVSARIFKEGKRERGEKGKREKGKKGKRGKGKSDLSLL